MKKFTFILIALIAGVITTLYAQWQHTNGPYGGRVNSLAVKRKIFMPELLGRSLYIIK